MRLQPTLRRLSPVLLVGAALCTVVGVAHAVGQPVPNGGVLNTVRDDFQTAIAGWGNNIQSAASRLFWTLAIISMVWTFGMMALRKAEFQEVIMELLRFSITLGFFLWLLTNGTTYSLSIFNSLAQLGQQASGLPGAATPSGIMSQGWLLWGMAFQQSSFVTHPVDSFVLLLTAVIIVIVFALIAVNYLLLTISAWLVSYAGIFLLGFGGSRWTSDLAIQYFKMALNVGLQIMTMILLVAVGWNFMQAQIAAIPPNGMSPTDLAAMMVAAIVLLELTNKVPPLVGSMAGGSTGGIGQHGAGTALTVGATGVAAASMAGSAVMGGLRGAAGGAQAIMAAYKAAGDGGGAVAGGGERVLGSGGASLAGGMGGHEGGSGAGSLSAAMGGATGGLSNSSALNNDQRVSGDVATEGSAATGSNADGMAAFANADEAAAATNADEAAAQTAATGAAPNSDESSSVGAGGSAAHSADSGSGLGKRLGRTAAILASATAQTALDHAKKRIQERSLGGKIAATIARNQAVQLTASTKPAGESELNDEAIDEIAAFSTRPTTPGT